MNIKILLFLLFIPAAAAYPNLGGPPVKDTDIKPAAEIKDEQCIGCHANYVLKTFMIANRCADCHVIGPKEYSTCEAAVINPKRLALDAQSKSCGKVGCHAGVLQKLKDSGSTMYDYSSCITCHNIHASKLNALLSKPREKICEPCHSLIPGDTSELSQLHRIFDGMEAGLTGDAVATRTPVCIDCHKEGTSHTMLAAPRTCLISECHTDKNTAWAENTLNNWKGIARETGYKEQKSVFPPQPKPPIPLGAKLAFTLASIAVVLVISSSLIASRRKEQ